MGRQRRRCRVCQVKTPEPGFRACSPATSTICAIGDAGRCNCKPSYYGAVYDRARNKYVKTKRMPTAEAARNARADLARMLEQGEAPISNAVRLNDARERFITAAREGRALNKNGHRYKPRAIDNVDESLRLHVEPILGKKRLSDIRRGDLQGIVDELAPRLSGSRVRSVVNAVRSLYRWAQDRDFASHNPAALVRLPAMDATPIERIASPAEFADLLAALALEDALPYALAGYAMGRRAQIVHLQWEEVDLKVGAIEWGVEWEARKYEASRRVVPTVPPLLAMLKRTHLEQGRPDGKQKVCPPRGNNNNRSGLLNTPGLGVRAREVWKEAGLTPITLQESRHTAATWLDAAGVPPKIASVLMGHATPARQPGAAQITLARYTHALPEDVEEARNRLAAYLAAHQEAMAGGG
jgi:integrase